MRKLLYFTIQLLKETFVQIFVSLDLVSLVLIYWKNVDIPIWVLVIIPIIGLYIGSFNIYKRGMRIYGYHFRTLDKPNSSSGVGTISLLKRSRAILTGNVANFGPQTGVLDECSSEIISINEIEDKFILDKLDIGASISPLLPKKEHVDWSPGSFQYTKIELPLVLGSGTIVPVCLKLHFEITQPYQEKIEEAAKWLKSIGIKIKYSVTQSDGRREELLSLCFLQNHWKLLLKMANE